MSETPTEDERPTEHYDIPLPEIVEMADVVELPNQALPEDNPNWDIRYEAACLFFPDMRSRGGGYRDCPGCVKHCARLGSPIVLDPDSETEPEPEKDPKREAQIAVMNELIEAQKAFHLKTAAYEMSLDHYKRIRAALAEPPDDVEDPEDPWHPVQGDMLNGYPVIVRDETGVPPQIILVDKDLRPPYYAGVTSFGVERDDMSAKELEQKMFGEGVPVEAPAEESVPEGLEDAAAEEEDPRDDPWLTDVP